MKIVLPNQCQAMGKKTSKKQGRKQINIRQPGRSVPNTRDGFWLLLCHEPFYDTLKLKQTMEEELVPYKNIFRDMKKQKSGRNYAFP